MSLYWARFVNYGSNIFRIDTRVYLQDVEKCRKSDAVIGAVVAKNPGSAQPSDTTSRSLQPITLANDRLIPTVRSFTAKAYRKANIAPPANAYIQVLNLFYLCNKDFNQALRSVSLMAELLTDPSESKTFPWIMYLWGAFEGRKAQYIRRFEDLNSRNHFYFDKNINELVSDVPGEGSFAKHTQGLELKPIIKYLATLIPSQ
jgi:hypothetical protein